MYAVDCGTLQFGIPCTISSVKNNVLLDTLLLILAACDCAASTHCQLIAIFI